MAVDAKSVCHASRQGGPMNMSALQSIDTKQMKRGQAVPGGSARTCRMPWGVWPTRPPSFRQ
eukprot:13201055-Alexandrium_andersonii.AAC.1